MIESVNLFIESLKMKMYTLNCIVGYNSNKRLVFPIVHKAFYKEGRSLLFTDMEAEAQN